MDVPVRPGEVVRGTLRFEHPIGYGAYGQVWKAWHEKLEQPRAVKIVAIHELGDTDLTRVTNECTIGGKLGSGKGVVQVFDAFEYEGHLYIVMELMQGGSLDKALREETREFDVTLSWVLEITEALRSVHAHGIIHRDIKPKNILISGDGHARLSDFGIAHLPRATITSYQPGTPGYRAPELEEGNNVTAAADVYSLCAVLFELWTGRTYAQYKALDQRVIRKEFLSRMKGEYPKVEQAVQEELFELIASGTNPVPGDRIELDEIIENLSALQNKRARSEREVEKARESYASELRPRPSRTIMSPLVQAPQADPSAPPGETALVDWIAEDFGSWFMESPDHDSILWFDPSQDWELVLPLLEPYLDLIRDQGSLLEVRYKLEKKDSGHQVVAYTPRTREEADYLVPFTFTSRVFERSLYQFLLDRNLPLPRYGESRQELERVLPLLVHASKGKGREFWQRIRSLEDAEQFLVPNFRERVFQFLTNPAEVWEDLRREGVDRVFLRMVQRRYGFLSEDDGPRGIADRLFAHWVMVDLYIRSGHADDFPSRNLLPHQIKYNDCQIDLDAFRHDSRYAETYFARMEDLERTRPATVSWARGQEPLMQDPPLVSLAREAWSGVAERIDAWDERSRVTGELPDIKRAIGQALSSYWHRQGVVPEWWALDRGVGVIEAAELAIVSGKQMSRPEEFIGRYAEEWWSVDAAYRAFHESLSSVMVPENLRRWVDRFYDDFIESINIAWTSSLEGIERWPPNDRSLSAISRSEEIWSGESRKAVFIVDALRYELAKELELELKGQNITLDHWVAALPSVTPIGMAALMPRAPEQKALWDEGWVVVPPGTKVNLADKAGRIAWLEEALSGATFLSLNDLLKPDRGGPHESGTMIVFADELDAWGETASELSIVAFSDLVEKVASGIRRVLSLGFDSVSVVTDHGFILLGQVKEHGKIEANLKSPLKLSHRYMIAKEGPKQEGLLQFGVEGSEDLVGFYPPGIACFKARGTYHYAHGGVSLQEIVLPFLQIKQDVSYAPVAVRLAVEDRIFSGIFKISLLPEKERMFVREREVRITVQNAENSVIYQATEIVGPEQGVTKNIKLDPSDNVKLGDRLSILINDAETGEELVKKEVEVHVDLEL